MICVDAVLIVHCLGRQAHPGPLLHKLDEVLEAPLSVHLSHGCQVLLVGGPLQQVPLDDGLEC
eukprot:2738525-Prorocentrum_lima.AAC.1